MAITDIMFKIEKNEMLYEQKIQGFVEIFTNLIIASFEK